MHSPAGGWEPRVVEVRRAPDPERPPRDPHHAPPDVVVVSRPEIIPPGLFDELPATTLGFLTEPLPRTASGPVHEDLRRRLVDLEAVTPANFDRIVSFDPLIAVSVAQT